MKNWKIVFGTDEIKPLELDTNSSPTTVYQRRNIEKVSKIEPVSNQEYFEWKREERELTLQEYSMLILMNEVKDEIINVQKEQIIDEYTLQLINEGVI